MQYSFRESKEVPITIRMLTKTPLTGYRFAGQSKLDKRTFVRRALPKRMVMDTIVEQKLLNKGPKMKTVRFKVRVYNRLKR